MPRPQTILIVDDDPTIQLMTSAGLRKTGYMTQQANDADRALDSMRASPPDLVLASVNLPGRDGFALIEAIREGRGGASHRDVPILILTGLDDTQSIHRAFTVGATDFITKPVNLALLAERIKYALAAAVRAQALADAQIEQSTACRMARLGFWRLDRATGRLYWSAEAEELLDCDALPDSHEGLIDRAAGNDRYRLKAAFDSAISRGQGTDVECSLWLKDDCPTTLRLQSEATPDGSWLIGAFQDVTALRAFEDRARYLAEYDELTDLPRRRLLDRLLADRIRQQSEQTWSVSVIRITGLSRVNSLLGITAGDQVVATFAQNLKGILPANAVIGRLEADTFAVAAPVPAIDGSVDAHEQWLAPLARSLSVAGEQVFVDCSAGISFYPQDASDAHTLISYAQQAQQLHHRRPGQARVTFYSDTDAVDESGVLSLESDIRKALGKDQFFLVYQLQRSLCGGRFNGVEALLRWLHPTHGVISPARFIPLLEENGLIANVGAWVLDEACRQLTTWQQTDPALVMGVNISAEQFKDPTLAECISRIARRHRIDPSTLELEVTESMGMEDPDTSRRTLEKLRMAGFRLAIDDFGTGHSSYESLLRFPMDTLKIDRSLIEAVADDPRNRSVIRSMALLAEGLGLKTIAEGVETEDQRNCLNRLEIDAIQGFLIHRPMEPDACTRLLEAETHRVGQTAAGFPTKEETSNGPR